MDSKKTYYKEIFYFSMITLFVTFFVLLLTTGGYSARGLLFADGDDTFMDFYNSMLYNIGNPYENYVFYPPFACFLYKALLWLIPPEHIENVIANGQTNSFTTDIKRYQSFILPFLLYSIIAVVFLALVLYYVKDGSKGEKYLFTWLIFFSAPMLFMFERANNIVFVLCLVLLYVKLYDSEKRSRRELALILLAVATAIKIYPVLFLAIPLRRKKFIDIIKMFLYTAVLTLIPLFVFYGGFDALGLLVQNLSSYGSNTGLQVGSQLNFSKCIIFPLFGTKLSNETLLTIGNVFKYVVTVPACIAAIFGKKTWQQAALCCCIIYGFQQTCATYLLILFVVPLVMFLNANEEKSAFNYAALVLLILTQGLLVSIMPVSGEFTRMIGTKITSYSILLLTFLLTWRGIADGWEVIRQIGKKK